MKKLDDLKMDYVLKPFEINEIKAGAASACWCHEITSTTHTVYLGGLYFIPVQ